MKKANNCMNATLTMHARLLSIAFNLFPFSNRCNRMGVVVLLMCIALGLSAQTTQTFTNSTPININRVGHSPTQYPSNITVSGMPTRLHEFVVRFDVFANGGLPDADMLLEAPDGQRIILLSDLPSGGTNVFYNVGIGTSGKDTINQNNIRDNTDFRPANYGTGSDTFPAPGPGAISQPQYPNSLVFQDINPNGTWKLYIEDDLNNSADIRLINGWSIQITAASFIACKRPSVPQLIAPSDFGAKLSWDAGAGNSNWDVLFTQNLNLNPVATTAPTHTNITQNQNVFLNGLQADKYYAVFVRANCGAGKVSPWVGRTIFKTTIHPCDLATPVSLCQEVDYPTLPSYPDYYFNYGPTWVFAFTAPEAGEYYMQFEGNSGYTPFYRLNNANNCDDSIWTEMQTVPGHQLTSRLPLMAAGQTCWIIHHSVQIAHQIFKIQKCPLRRMVLQGVAAATDSLNVGWLNLPRITEPLEYYIGQKPLLAPNENTPPTITVQVLDPNTDRVTFPNLQPDTDYQFYVRSRCSNGKASCWQGPFEGKTSKVCSKVTLFRVDTVTQAWAKTMVKFTNAGPNFVSNLDVVVCRAGQNPTYNWLSNDSYGVSTTRDSFPLLLTSLPMTQPLKVYVKLGCVPLLGAQSWQGPFDLPIGQTPSSPVTDLFCGDAVYTYDNNSVNSPNYMQFPKPPCYDQYYGSFGERIFRYRANADDTLLLRWATGFSSSGLNNGVTFYSKSASLPLDPENWIHRGCWRMRPLSNIWDPANWPDIRIPVKKDSVYHILCDAFGSYAAGFPIYVVGCRATCPKVDTLFFDAATMTTVNLRWKSARQGASYRIDYEPAWSTLPQFARTVTTTDTFIRLTGLLSSGEYQFKIRTLCSPTDVSNAYATKFQLKSHLIVKEAAFSRCNPNFVPPNAPNRVNYEVFELTVPQNGDYFFTASAYDIYLYGTAFDAANPSVNLIASVSNYGSDGRKDTTLALQSGKQYFCVLGYINQQFNVGTAKDLKLWIDGPAEAQVSPAKWQGTESSAHGKIPFAGTYAHTGACRDTSGWVHYYKIADDVRNINDDALLFSVQLNRDANALNLLPLVMYNNPTGATLIQNPPATFIQNPSGWYEMNRIWLMQDLLPAQQIDEDFKIKVYYTQRDYELIKTAIVAAGGRLDRHESMYFHKINGFHNYQHVVPWAQHSGVPGATRYDSAGYWSYSNSTEATTSTWRHGQFAGEHFAEMVVHGFSGGGGGASVNGKNISNLTTKTTEAATKTGLRLLPNPNTGIFTVELLIPAYVGKEMRIVDITGRVLLLKQLDIGSQSQRVDVGVLPQGLYLLQIVSEGRVLAVEKFAKQ
jgi:hypothetical protein